MATPDSTAAPASVVAPPSVAFEPSPRQVSPPPVSATLPVFPSSTASSGTIGQVKPPAPNVPGVAPPDPDGSLTGKGRQVGIEDVLSAATTVPGDVESSTTLPFVPSSTLPSVSSSARPGPGGAGVSACCVSWSTEELEGVFKGRLRAFRLLSVSKYDVSTPLGAFCWAWWEVQRAYTFEAALNGELFFDESLYDDGEGGGGVAFEVLRETLVERARRGDDEAIRVLQEAVGVLLDAADVIRDVADVRKLRILAEGYSVASVVEAVDIPEVRATALSAEDAEWSSRAEAFFAWVDEYKREPVSGESALDGDSFPPGYCSHPPPFGLKAEETPAEEVVEAMRALTLEEVDALTLEQLLDMEIEAAFDNGYLLRDFPLDLQFAWGEKGFIESTEYMKALCCYSMTTDDLVESFVGSEDTDGDYGGGIPSLYEALEEYNRNENDPSTPLGAFCWASLETYRSFSLYQFGHMHETMLTLLRNELLLRAEMGNVAAADAVRVLPSEVPSGKYAFGEALAAADDPRVRATAFDAADPVLLEVVEVFYGLVDEHRQEEAANPYVFMAEFLPYMGLYQQPGSEERVLEAEVQARQSLWEECKFPGEDW